EIPIAGAWLLSPSKPGTGTGVSALASTFGVRYLSYAAPQTTTDSRTAATVRVGRSQPGVDIDFPPGSRMTAVPATRSPIRWRRPGPVHITDTSPEAENIGSA